MKRVLQIFFGGTGFMLCFAPVVLGGVANAGSALGMTVFGGFFLWGVFRPFIVKKLTKAREKKAVKIITNILCIILLSGFIIAGAETAAMIYTANIKPSEDATVVVLGCGVNGTTPSKMLNTRIKAAEKYLKEHPDAKCITSGGMGKKEDISEAECIKTELIKRGIEEERIYTEAKSTSTRENLLFSSEIIEEKGLNKEIAVVTNEFHQLRAKMVAKGLGLDASSVPAKTPWGLITVYWLREFGGVTLEFLF